MTPEIVMTTLGREKLPQSEVTKAYHLKLVQKHSCTSCHLGALVILNWSVLLSLCSDSGVPIHFEEA